MAQRIVYPAITRVHSLSRLPDFALSPAAEMVRTIIVAAVGVMASIASGEGGAARDKRAVDGVSLLP